LDHLRKNNFTQAYSLIEQTHEITQMEEFQTLYAPFERHEREAYRLAFDGNTGEILLLLREFLPIPLLKDKIASIVKISYLNCFMRVESVELTDWKGTIEYYSLFFGIDSDIKETAKKLGIEEVLYKILGGKDKYGYRKYDFIDEIVKMKTEEQLRAEKMATKKDRSHLYHLLFLLGGVGLLSLIAYIMLNLFSGAISSYKEDRRQGPYKLFEKVYEQTGKPQ
jgi:hypothetical protein